MLQKIRTRVAVLATAGYRSVRVALGRPGVRMALMIVGLAALNLFQPIAAAAQPFQHLVDDLKTGAKDWAIGLGGVTLLVAGYQVFMGHEQSGETLRKAIIALALLGGAYAGAETLLTTFNLN
jgi:hypothetical protein